MGEEFDYQVCPGCRGEFTLVVSRCSECDLDLVSPQALEDGMVHLPPASELVCIRVAPVAWIQALSEALENEEVIHRVEPASAEDAPEGQDASGFGSVPLVGLYVQDAHVIRASELDLGIAVQLTPQESPALPEGESEACPACGELLAGDVLECPECGLVFGG